MSIPLVDRPHHFQGFSADAEKHIDKLRQDARHELQLRKDLSARSQAAYQRGDGEQAHQLSQESKAHGANADRLFQQASDYALRDRNGPDRASDEIDLHGQLVQDAERILLQRLAAEKERGSSYLHVITGQGFHSVNHDPKLKPAIEDLLRKREFNFRVEEHNAGRILVDLKGDQDLSHAPPAGDHGYGQAQQHGQGQGYQRPPAQQYGGQQGNAQNDQDIEQKLIKEAVNKCASCCIIM